MVLLENGVPEIISAGIILPSDATNSIESEIEETSVVFANDITDCFNSIVDKSFDMDLDSYQQSLQIGDNAIRSSGIVPSGVAHESIGTGIDERDVIIANGNCEETAERRLGVRFQCSHTYIFFKNILQTF
ncbi:hypothetical protein L2E82_05210 [Cichorium intybus]|uniref:Uncharacterized protein n=1 Tax=Cichorium intybus TaxID=13427 RepID=A0ACB9H859_CICIN|nr:hypothetical protein L2E82_05210 [Cichorium intybus]